MTPLSSIHLSLNFHLLHPNSQPDHLVYLHHLQTLNSPFQSHVSKHFTLLNPWTFSPDYTSLIPSILTIICIDPLPFTSETLSFFPSLKLIVSCSINLDHIDLHERQFKGIRVTNANKTLAEAMALIINVLRKVSVGNQYMRNRLWIVLADRDLNWVGDSMSPSLVSWGDGHGLVFLVWGLGFLVL